MISRLLLPSELHVILDSHLSSHSCSPTNSLLKNYLSLFFRYASPNLLNQLHHSLRQPRLDLPIPDSSLLQHHLTSHMSSSPLLSSITPSFFFFQPQNFSFSQILHSTDIWQWHLFGLISWIPGLLYGFFFISVFSSFSYRYFLIL